MLYYHLHLKISNNERCISNGKTEAYSEPCQISTLFARTVIGFQPLRA